MCWISQKIPQGMIVVIMFFVKAWKSLILPYTHEHHSVLCTSTHRKRFSHFVCCCFGWKSSHYNTGYRVYRVLGTGYTGYWVSIDWGHIDQIRARKLHRLFLKTIIPKYFRTSFVWLVGWTKLKLTYLDPLNKKDNPPIGENKKK